MSNKRKVGGWHSQKKQAPAASRHGRNCGCTAMVVRTAEGVCDECGYAGSMTFPPMPSSQGLGGVAEVGWSCPECGTGEVVGRGVVTEVR